MTDNPSSEDLCGIDSHDSPKALRRNHLVGIAHPLSKECAVTSALLVLMFSTQTFMRGLMYKQGSTVVCVSARASVLESVEY